jgi:hypothetical protein
MSVARLLEVVLRGGHRHNLFASYEEMTSAVAFSKYDHETDANVISVLRDEKSSLLIDKHYDGTYSACGWGGRPLVTHGPLHACIDALYAEFEDVLDSLT